MEPRLKEFYSYDCGFAQFVERHGMVASDPKAREEYDLWRYNQWLTMKEASRNKAEGRAEGRAEGSDERNMEIASKAFRKAKSADNFLGIIETLREFDIPEETIQIALDEVKASK
jgi:hypothetical protein